MTWVVTYTNYVMTYETSMNHAIPKTGSTFAFYSYCRDDCGLHKL